MALLDTWPVLEAEEDGWPKGSLVAAPVLTFTADCVAAEALRLGRDRGVLLNALIWAGLGIVAANGLPTPEPKFPEAGDPE